MGSEPAQVSAFGHWDKLLYGIQRGECTLFLGPELPVAGPGGEPRVPARALADRLLAQLENGERGSAGPDPRDLAHVAQRFLAEEDEVGLEMEVTRWHDELAGRRSALHDDLAAMPFRLIVTSGHDPLMEAALRRAGKTPAVERYHYRGRSKELLPVPSDEAPVLFHLYGHVAEPPSMVLSETQLLDFLAALISSDPPLPNDLNAALTNGRLFLFLGFGLEQWYLRILLHVLKVLRRSSRAFAIEAPKQGDEAADGAILFYRENFKVEVLHDEVGGFVRELRRRYVPPPAAAIAPAAAAAPAASEVPVAERAAALTASIALPRRPKVFLCHAGEDAARAREIHDALVRAGLDPWLDKAALRGGDRWDSRIEAAIQGVDYFVVLNSRALAAKSRQVAYVNKEIKVALRAEDWRLGSFIIPVLLDDAPLLEPLAAYHAVDLGGGHGARDLVRAIKRRAENA